MQNIFDEFLIEIPLLLEDLQELLEKSINYKRVKVNCELDSIDLIESFYLDVLKGKEVINISEARLNRIIIAYFGNCVIHHVGGKWAVGNLENDVAFQTPIIINWGSDPNSKRISPVVIREYILEKMERGSMRWAIEYYSKKIGSKKHLF